MLTPAHGHRGASARMYSDQRDTAQCTLSAATPHMQHLEVALHLLSVGPFVPPIRPSSPGHGFVQRRTPGWKLECVNQRIVWIVVICPVKHAHAIGRLTYAPPALIFGYEAALVRNCGCIVLREATWVTRRHGRGG